MSILMMMTQDLKYIWSMKRISLPAAKNWLTSITSQQEQLSLTPRSKWPCERNTASPNNKCCKSRRMSQQLCSRNCKIKRGQRKQPLKTMMMNWLLPNPKMAEILKKELMTRMKMGRKHLSCPSGSSSSLPMMSSTLLSSRALFMTATTSEWCLIERRLALKKPRSSLS